MNVEKHAGRLKQIKIYLGKEFRMFIFQNDWKVLPMAAVIAGIVSFAVGGSLFQTMEGTATGTFALACVCVWNGFFNSIQVICRERAIVKREHRSGMHISSYVVAHMLYQAFLCILQSAIIIGICVLTGVKFPQKPLFIQFPFVDYGITLFLITFSADMLALLVSAIARTTTGAMTVMPFLLIIQLVFAGTMFNLPEATKPIQDMTITKWGMTALCAQADYNALPMVSVWNSLAKMKDVEVEGEKPIKEVLVYIEQNDLKTDFLMDTAGYNTKPEYDHDAKSIAECWGWIILWALVYVILTVAVLEFIDKDKR